MRSGRPVNCTAKPATMVAAEVRATYRAIANQPHKGGRREWQRLNQLKTRSKTRSIRWCLPCPCALRFGGIEADDEW